MSVFIHPVKAAKTCIHLKSSGKSSKHFLFTGYFGGCAICQFDSPIALLVVAHETLASAFQSILERSFLSSPFFQEGGFVISRCD